MLQELTFDELKSAMRNCTTKLLMFIIMMANGELMDRCDKNTLEKKENEPELDIYQKFVKLLQFVKDIADDWDAHWPMHAKKLLKEIGEE